MQPDWASAAVFIGSAHDIRQLLSKVRASLLTKILIFGFIFQSPPDQKFGLEGVRTRCQDII
jgi:hypothetical protein